MYSPTLFLFLATKLDLVFHCVAILLLLIFVKIKMYLSKVQNVFLKLDKIYLSQIISFSGDETWSVLQFHCFSILLFAQLTTVHLKTTGGLQMSVSFTVLKPLPKLFSKPMLHDCFSKNYRDIWRIFSLSMDDFWFLFSICIFK